MSPSDSSALPDWYSFSFPSAEQFPKHKLSRSELRFLRFMLEHSITGEPFPLYPADELAIILKSCWGELFSTVSSSTLRKHLLRGKSYAESKSYPSSPPLRLFSKGLVRAYRIPTSSGYSLLYGYPRSRYRLLPENFVSPTPPHDYFHQQILQLLWSDIPEGSLHVTSDSLLKIPHWDGSGEYIADMCYRLTVTGNISYVWIEAHTGSEGYDESVFLKRLLSAEVALRGRGEYLVIVPFTIDLDTVGEAIRAYNNQTAVLDGIKPALDLRLTTIIDYRRINHWKHRKGLVKHKTIV
ncbi:MAG: hypothetical protein JXA54_13380 [Candidatus Heimdallarchaeota archaeon]|nr:hypothetical protein [Candidatus Heimdallarchaeota archaeon]